MQLRAARYRLVNLLWISVVSVTVTERCFFVQLMFKRVCLGCFVLSLYPNEMADPKEYRMVPSFVVTVSNQLLRPMKFLKRKPLVIIKWVKHILFSSIHVSEGTKFNWGFERSGRQFQVGLMKMWKNCVNSPTGVNSVRLTMFAIFCACNASYAVPF